MSEYKNRTIISIDLGKPEVGDTRKLALERLAERAGFAWNDNPSIGKWLINLADRELEMDKLSRDTDVTITSRELVQDKKQTGPENITWLEIKTDHTGDRVFRKYGFRTYDIKTNKLTPSQQAMIDSVAPGTVIKLRDLHQIPVKRWEWIAYNPGFNFQVGEMLDGLNDICPKLVYWHVGIYRQEGTAPTAEMEAVAKRAALTGDAQAAKKILEDSGLFEDVFDFNDSPNVRLDQCVELCGPY